MKWAFFLFVNIRRPIPHEDLKKLGIQLPPEGRYMSRTQVYHVLNFTTTL